MIAFRLAGDKVAALQARLKLDEQVFRVQVVTAPVVTPVAKKDVGDGVAE